MEPTEAAPLVTGIERRFVPQQAAQLRAVERDGEDPVIEGTIAVYNTWSPVYGWFRERIASTFFEKAIGRDDVRALFNHDPNWVLGRTAAGTMELSTDDAGLQGRIVVDRSSTLLRDLVVLPIKRRDVTGASFSFDMPPKSVGEVWEKGPDGVWNRTLVSIGTLYDGGPVTFPFYPTTSVAARSAMGLDEAKRSLEEWLAREATTPEAKRELDELEHLQLRTRVAGM